MHITKGKTILAVYVLVLALSAGGQPFQTGEGKADLWGDMQLEWIGKGVPQKLFDAEIMISQGIIPDSATVTGANYDGSYLVQVSKAQVGLTFHGLKPVDIVLRMPFIIKQGREGKTGPFGDLDLDIGAHWKFAQAALNLTFPTGYSSIMSGELRPFSYNTQSGRGLFSAAASASYVLDAEWGAINLGCSYGAGLFAVRPHGYLYDTVQDKILIANYQFDVARDGWAAKNGAGLLIPDRVGVFADMTVKTEVVTHCFGIGYYYPTASATYEVYKRTVMDFDSSKNFPTAQAAQDYLNGSSAADNVTYSVAGKNISGQWVSVRKTTSLIKTLPSLFLQYNVEKNDMLLPIFLGAMVKFDYENRLNFSGFSAGIGFKFPVF
jgi:hypothetical protein